MMLFTRKLVTLSFSKKIIGPKLPWDLSLSYRVCGTYMTMLFTLKNISQLRNIHKMLSRCFYVSYQICNA